MSDGLAMDFNLKKRQAFVDALGVEAWHKPMLILFYRVTETEKGPEG